MRLTLCILLLAVTVLAQEETNAPPNYAVQFYGVNTNGVPQFWPKAITSIGTNTVVPDGWGFFTEAQLDDLKATNAAAFKAYNDAKHAAENARMAANLARILDLFSQIPQGRSAMTNIQNATISNISQASTHIKTLANVLDKVLEELQRLGPVLKEEYRADKDTTQ